TADDIMTFDLEGVPGDDRPAYLERFIHAAIYAARPDVHAVVHSHAPAVLPFSIGATPLQAVAHIAGFLGPRVPVFEVRDVLGPSTDLLIRDRRTGDALAAALGEAAVVLLRGHGFVAVAESVRLAVATAVYTPVNARIQAEAMAMGSWTPL